MFRRFVPVLSVLTLFVPFAHAQDASPATEDEGWRTSLVGQLAFNQAAYHRWQEGGLDALSLTASLNGQFERDLGTFLQAHSGRLAFGVVKQDTLNLRKAVDVIRYTFNLQYTGTGAWRPTFATELRTQFATGFDYSPTAEKYPYLAEQGYLVPGERLKVSAFFAPAAWTQSLGLTYRPAEWFRARSGLGMKETFVTIERLRPLYGNALDEPVRLEAGLESLVELQREVVENVFVESRLSGFYAFNQFKAAPPDAVWETFVRMKVNAWLNVNVEFVALYDQDTVDAIQLKESLSVGVSVAML